MDRRNNPYAPGVGLQPPELAGRDTNAAQIATLRRQVEHFGGQVTRLIADYRALATLRRRWN